MMSRRTLAIGTVLALAVAACSSDEATPISGDRSGTEPVPTGSSLPTPSTVAPEPSTIPETSVVPETPVTEPTIAAPEPTLAPEPPVVPPTEVWSVTQVDAELPNADAFYARAERDGVARWAPACDLWVGHVAQNGDLRRSGLHRGGGRRGARYSPGRGDRWVSAALRGDGSPVIVTTSGGGSDRGTAAGVVRGPRLWLGDDLGVTGDALYSIRGW